LDEYFNFDKEMLDAKYMIFSPNSTDGFHLQLKTNSSFQENIEKLILKNKYHKDTISLKLHKSKTRLFNDEDLVWGELTATKIENNETESFLYIASNLSVEFPDPDE